MNTTHTASEVSLAIEYLTNNILRLVELGAPSHVLDSATEELEIVITQATGYVTLVLV